VIFFLFRLRLRQLASREIQTVCLVVKKMDELAVDRLISTADFGEEEPGSTTEERTLPTTHLPPTDADVIMMREEMMCEQTVEDIPMPELMDQDKDVDSESKDDEESLKNEDHDPLNPFRHDDSGSEELLKELEEAAQQSSTQRSQRSTKGVRRYDEVYDWNLMNLSVNTALQDFGDVAEDACKNELVQLFKEKNALVPVKKQDLSEEQLKKVVRSHMFLKEKFEDGTFIKLKACLVADGRT
jgi:hypothetical protein